MSFTNSRFLGTIPLLISIWILCGVLPVCTQAEIVYEIVDLGTLGGDYSVANSINEAGQIVGGAYNSQGVLHATLFDSTGVGNNIDLSALRGSQAFSINDAGDIVGAEDGNATLFDPTGAGNNIALGSDYSVAYCINNAGQIVGSARNSVGIYRATLFDPTGGGNNIDLGTIGDYGSEALAINNAGQIVGSSSFNDKLFPQATLFDPTGSGENIDLGSAGDNRSGAYSINDAGDIVGAEGVEDANATLFDPTGSGNNIDLGKLVDDGFSVALSINDDRKIVGNTYYEYSGTRYVRGTLFDPTAAGNNIDLNTLIDPDSGWTLEYTNDINNNRWIVGSGRNPEGKTHAFLLVPISTKYSGGTGEPNDPYQIATAEGLMLLGETPEDYDKHFILTADIDLDPNLPGRKIFDKAVIAWDAPFTGVFDGNGHAISNLTITGGGQLGLIGELDSGAEVRGVGVKDVNITGSGGGLVGTSYGNISNCYSTGTVTGHRWVGGLVGYFGLGTIVESFSVSVVSGEEYVGGLVGKMFSGNISDSHSMGMVNANIYVGGLVGCNGILFDGGLIAYSYNRSEVRGEVCVGGLVGNNGRDASIIQSYSDGEVTGNEIVGGLVGCNYQGEILNCYSVGSVSGDKKTGGLVGSNSSGTVNLCYSSGMVIGNENVGGLIGGNDIGGPIGNSKVEVLASFWNTQTSGQSNSDGGTGLTIAEMQMAATFIDAGWDFVGEIANGHNDVWKIVEGQTYPLLSWQKYGGGTGEPNNPYLIFTAEQMNAIGTEPNDWNKYFKLMADIDLSGYLYDKAVIAPHIGNQDLFNGTPFSGVFNGNGHTVLHLANEGASMVSLFGYLDSGAEVRDLGIVDVNIIGTGTEVGGLVAENHGYVTNCYSTGTVSGGDFVVGGLVGSNYGTVSHCCSNCEVSGNNIVGGLIGFNHGTVIHCYSNGAVSGSWQVGGLVGFNEGDMTKCFWDVETSGQTTSDGGTGLSTAEMQTASTFLEAGWDFVDETENGTDDIWWINEGQDYPRLWWELIPEN